MKYLKLLLLPFSFIYGAITAVRNALFDIGVLRTVGFEIPVIAVGNLTVGGTGKTPHVEYLLRLLNKYRLATLSRGYKRKTKGFILADDTSTPSQLGDESFQYHTDFPNVAVSVCEDRVEGVEKLRQQLPQLDAVILDDAMQHRAIKPSFTIMLTDYGRPFHKDFILPAGLLRESRSGAKRADVVVVSKCPPDLGRQELETLKAQISKYTKPSTPIYFSGFKYGQPVSIGAGSELSKNTVLMTGIANPEPFRKYLQQEGFNIVKDINYPDHYEYKAQDLLEVKDFIDRNKSQNISVIITSKDAAKLTGPTLQNITKDLPVFYLPIEVSFLQDAYKFDSMVLEHVEQLLVAKNMSGSKY